MRRIGKGDSLTEPHDTTPYEVKEKKNAPRKKPRRRALRRYDRLGVGSHSERAMAGMYRRAGVTPDQLAEDLGISKVAAGSTLRGLAANKLARKAAINPHWAEPRPQGGRPHELWFLNGEGVAYGGALNGVENPKRARRDHGRANLPAHTAHVDLRNGWFFRAAEQAASVGAVLSLDSCWGEPYPGFPVYADPAPEARTNERRQYGRLEPDGTFLLEPRDGLVSTRYYLEVETRRNPREVLSKIDRYSGWFSRLAREADGPYASEALGPVLFLFREPRSHKSLQRVVWQAVADRSDRLARFFAWHRTLQDHDAAAGDLFLFGALLPEKPEEERPGPLDRVLRPLATYPENLGGWTVGVEDAAELLRRQRERPAKEAS